MFKAPLQESARSSSLKKSRGCVNFASLNIEEDAGKKEIKGTPYSNLDVQAPAGAGPIAVYMKPIFYLPPLEEVVQDLGATKDMS